MWWAAWKLVSNDAKRTIPSAKCEAFHVAPRLFFMFLFLITFTIRQQCIIYPQDFSTEPKSACVGHWCGDVFADMLKSA